VYDKSNDRVFRAHIANVAAESGFYDFRIGDEVFSIEAGLGELEDAAAPILLGVIKEQSLAHLTEQAFVVMARFVAAQVMRTPSLIAQSDRIAEQIRQRLRERGDDPDLAANRASADTPSRSQGPSASDARMLRIRRFDARRRVAYGVSQPALLSVTVADVISPVVLKLARIRS
jgi:hypothetical protein